MCEESLFPLRHFKERQDQRQWREEACCQSGSNDREVSASWELLLKAVWNVVPPGLVVLRTPSHLSETCPT